MDQLSIAVTVFGLVGLAGGAAGFYKSNRGNSIIEYQSREIALRDGTIARLEKSEAALTAERDRLHKENGTLKELAQGSPQLAKLTQAILDQTKMLHEALKSKRR